ncbi:MAG: hypothetical protein Q8Q12_21640 [bacterium]|nr:hypothetical protein [bacterium]
MGSADVIKEAIRKTGKLSLEEIQELIILLYKTQRAIHKLTDFRLEHAFFDVMDNLPMLEVLNDKQPE